MYTVRSHIQRTTGANKNAKTLTQGGNYTSSDMNSLDQNTFDARPYCRILIITVYGFCTSIYCTEGGLLLIPSSLCLEKTHPLITLRQSVYWHSLDQPVAFRNTNLVSTRMCYFIQPFVSQRKHTVIRNIQYIYKFYIIYISTYIYIFKLKHITDSQPDCY